jgi:hypothetical protein
VYRRCEALSSTPFILIFRVFAGSTSDEMTRAALRNWSLGFKGTVQVQRTGLQRLYQIGAKSFSNSEMLGYLIPQLEITNSLQSPAPPRFVSSQF